MKYLLFYTFILLGCSAQKPKEEPIVYSKDNPEVNTTDPKSPSITARELAAELGSHLVTEITFEKGSTELDRSHRQKIEELYKKAKKQSPIESVSILAWADKGYPARDQEGLAESRAENVKKYLKSINKAVTTIEINMATKPSKLSTLFKSEEAKIKKSLQIHESYQDKTSTVMVIFMLRQK